MTLAVPTLSQFSFRRYAERVVQSLDRTPGQLGAARALLLVMCVVAGGAGVSTAFTKVDVARVITHHTQPLSAHAVAMYRALADADATAAREFLAPSERGKAEARVQYDDAVKRAAAGLTGAGQRVAPQSLSADRIAVITEQLPVYTALVERARAEKDVARLREASAGMQSTILRQVEGLLRDESARLDRQYRQVGALPAIALGAGALCLGTLLLVQGFVFRKTKRVLNLGLVLATAAVAVAVLWWAVAFSLARPKLQSSERRTATVTAALGQGQIAARQARASELRAVASVVTRSDEDSFEANMQILARGVGTEESLGGALGAARRFAADPTARKQVEAAVDHAMAWVKAHDEVRALVSTDRSRAVTIALSREPGGAADAFEKLDAALSQAVDDQGRAFRRDIASARAALAGLVPGTGVLAVVAAIAGGRGLGRRLAEYR